MGEKSVNKPRGKKTTIRIPEEMLSRILEHAERRGRSLNTTILDLIDNGFDWVRMRFSAMK